MGSLQLASLPRPNYWHMFILTSLVLSVISCESAIFLAHCWCHLQIWKFQEILSCRHEVTSEPERVVQFCFKAFSERTLQFCGK